MSEQRVSDADLALAQNSIQHGIRQFAEEIVSLRAQVAALRTKLDEIADLLDHWPPLDPGGKPYEINDWRGLIDPRLADGGFWGKPPTPAQEKPE